MLPILRFIAGGWTFFWRQPALHPAAFFLVFLPSIALTLLEQPFNTAEPEQMAVLVVLTILCIILLTWGSACVLTVGKRLLQAKAGRTRTSFKAVQQQARGLIIPLLLTNILFGSIAVLWAIPLVVTLIAAGITAGERGIPFVTLLKLYPWIPVLLILLALPSVRFCIRTIFTPLVVVYEKTAFRPALTRSKALTDQHFTMTTVVFIVLIFLWFPGILLQSILSSVMPAAAAATFTAVLDTGATVLWYLTLTQYYKAVGGRAV